MSTSTSASASGSSKGKANGDKEANKDTVTLVSEDGESFSIAKSAAVHSGTIKDMLEGGFAESESRTVQLQIR